MLGIDISARYWPTVHTAAVPSSPNNLSFNGSPSHVLIPTGYRATFSLVRSLRRVPRGSSSAKDLFLAIEDSTLASLPTVLPPRAFSSTWGRAVSSILTSPILPSFQRKAVSPPGAGSLQGEGGCSGRSSSWLVHQSQASARRTQWTFRAGDTRADQYCPGEESSLMVPLEMPPHRV
ncbi:hypothetical protein CKAH01_11051 [Colletotrichum kahawae]|uniref:Uncharacterized protein n=1 Tax=Colletotrichum kahawae TaxID=34407 RepID=A0AAE0CWY5_COLKA|nr:hypothetical protein CKAH01_11051 [Colletotrichum kahawae]